MDVSHDLDRFLAAQRDTYDTALAEVRAGTKRSHWMWFIFPQIAGLGRSPTARFYALAGIDEARRYLAHPLLGPRVREITAALQTLPEPDARRVFGSIDAIKLRSSLTLFAHADGGGDEVFRQAIDRWFGGQDDPETVRLLGSGS